MQIRNPQLVLIFVLINIAIALFVWAAVYRPIRNRIANSMTIIELQENRLAIYEAHARAYLAGAFILEEDPNAFVRFADLALVLDEILRKANLLELVEREFLAAEAMGLGFHQADIALMEVRVAAVFVGSMDNARAFLSEIDEHMHHVHVRTAHIQGQEGLNGGDVQLTLGLSITVLGESGNVP